jgi:hypothetical protein
VVEIVDRRGPFGETIAAINRDNPAVEAFDHVCVYDSMSLAAAVSEGRRSMARLVRIPYDQARRLTALATSGDFTAFVVGQTYIELVLRGCSPDNSITKDVSSLCVCHMVGIVKSNAIAGNRLFGHSRLTKHGLVGGTADLASGDMLRD